jgi:SDR family mycofactocin-dependent oxidoreductase
MTSDRVAIITGAARGIGAATTIELTTAGYQVIAIDACLGANTTSMSGVKYPLATEDDLIELEKKGNGKIHPLICDVRDLDSVSIAVEKTLSSFGRIDVAVAAAAVISGGQPMWKIASNDFQALIDTDITGVWNLGHSCLPSMIASESPQLCRFIALASAAGTHGLRHLAGYSAVKHAVIGLVKGIAADLEGTGVVACAVSPGSTRTSMLQASADIYELENVEGFNNSTLLNRLIEPEEIAQAIAFCCSPAGSIFNGSVLDLSGGFRP